MLLLRTLLAIACALLVPAPASAGEPLVVQVGGYSFPPFVEGDKGLTHDLIRALNDYQRDYRFVFVPTSSGRRYKDMAAGAYSVIFFEHINWGWNEAEVAPTRVFLRGDGEVYVALAKPGRNQRFFDDLSQRSLLGVTGYHYGFADYEGDRGVLEKRFRISFANDAEALLRMLLNERGEVAVVTRSYLDSYLQSRPALRAKLLVSEKYDQHYEHMALVRKGHTPGAAEIERLLDGMEKAGILKRLWARYGLRGGGAK